MAKKTKELKEPNKIDNISVKEKNTIKSKTTTKKKASTSATKKTPTKKSTTAKASKSSSKKGSVTKASTSKKADTKKTSTTSKKASTTKKTSASKAKATSKTKSTKTVKSTQTKKAATKKVATKKEVFESEYYDLPYSYNKTVVKLLAQTPKTLFIYWEVSEEDRANFKKTYGENFFEITKPVLIVHNDTLNYSFEVEINDFANSWYLNINDSQCNYRVELGRKPLPMANQHIYSQNEPSEATEITSKQTAYIPYYIFFTSSNNMDAPNNKILFNQGSKTLLFRNVKTGQVTEKNINDFQFVTNLGIFNIRDLYKFLSKDEYEKFDLANPSSGNPSSLSFSSQFK